MAAEYRRQCDCRKPLPGLLFKAAHEKNIDFKESWLIGDNLSDIQAGKAAGCRTVLIGTMKCELCRVMKEKNIFPDRIAGNMEDAVRNYILLKEFAGNFVVACHHMTSEATKNPGWRNRWRN